MKKEEITLLQAGDVIDYRTHAFSAGRLESTGIATAPIVGTTQESALIKSSKYPLLTIAVQAHNIVAAYREIAGDVVPLYVDIQPAREDEQS